MIVVQIFYSKKQSQQLLLKLEKKNSELQKVLEKLKVYEVEIDKQVSSRTLAIKEEYDENRERDLILKKALKRLKMLISSLIPFYPM